MKEQEKIEFWNQELKKVFKEYKPKSKEEIKKQELEKSNKNIREKALNLVKQFDQEKEENNKIKIDEKRKQFELLSPELRIKINYCYVQGTRDIEIYILAELFGVSERTIYNWIKRSQIKNVTHNQRANIDLFSDVLNIIKKDEYNIKLYKIFKKFINYKY